MCVLLVFLAFKKKEEEEIGINVIYKNTHTHTHSFNSTVVIAAQSIEIYNKRIGKKDK